MIDGLNLHRVSQFVSTEVIKNLIGKASFFDFKVPFECMSPCEGLHMQYFEINKWIATYEFNKVSVRYNRIVNPNLI